MTKTNKDPFRGGVEILIANDGDNETKIVYYPYLPVKKYWIKSFDNWVNNINSSSIEGAKQAFRKQSGGGFRWKKIGEIK